jgi:hypothetical protein
VTARRIVVPNYPELRLSEPGLWLLRQVHRFDQGARSDVDGKRERVYRPGPFQGQAAKALVNRGLLRYAAATGHVWVDGVEVTAAGCAVLAALTSGDVEGGDRE